MCNEINMTIWSWSHDTPMAALFSYADARVMQACVFGMEDKECLAESLNGMHDLLMLVARTNFSP